jgi:hypothetical protein
VIEDIQHTGAKSIFFGDSDFGGKRARAMELMEAMVPLKVRWSALWTSNLCSDAEYMDLAKRSWLVALEYRNREHQRRDLEGDEQEIQQGQSL